MKKTLLAVAAMAVVGAASAQSSVTLYGYGDLGVGQSVGLDQKFQFNPGLADVGGIRIGMKGSEDLGGGLKANFQLESNAYDEVGNGSGFNRATWFSISGGFGELRLGRQARNSVVAGVGTSVAGWRGSDPEAAVGIRYSINNNVGASSRQSALINYISPNVSGFSARLGYETEADNGANGAVTDIGLFYAAGPLSLAYGYIKADNQEKNQGVHVGYDMGVALLTVSYNDRGSIGALAAQKGFSLGAKVPMGAATIFAQYARNNDSEVDAYELGVDYALSKRTALTAFLAKTKDLDMGYFTGVRHSF